MNAGPRKPRFTAARRQERARERALAEWRGVDLTPLEVARSVKSHALGALMPRVIEGLRLDQRRAEAEIGRVWNHLLDPALTAHAQPAGMARGTLFVRVDSNVWLSEIVRYRAREILDRLQHAFGKGTIARISYRLG